MLCPECDSKLKVYDTSDAGDEVYRLRECPECGHRLYTVEFEVQPDKKFRKAWCENHRFRDKKRKQKEKKS